NGRNRDISPVGMEFYEHARAILAQNDAALRLGATKDVTGIIRLGIIQDFAEDFFPKALLEFSDQFQNIRVEVLVERSRILLDLLEKDQLDQVIAFKHSTHVVSTLLNSSKMIWLGQKEFKISTHAPLPIVLVDGPCLFREEALKALGNAGIQWDIKLTSPSLACVAAAAEAGMGVTVRTADLMRRKRNTLAELSELPSLPDIQLHLYSKPEVTSPAIRHLAEYWAHCFQQRQPPLIS
ncbi:MAG: LysR substrate-binding domain-containing protein, partial [Sneathiella sp.]